MGSAVIPLPYSGRLLREKTFVNFKVLWLFRESFLKIWAREIIWQHQRVFRKVFPTKTFHQFVKVCPTKVSCYTVYYRDSTLQRVTLHNACYLEIFLNFITILSSHSLTIQLFSNLFMALVSLVLALCSHFQGTYILCVVVRPCSAAFDHFSCHFVNSCTPLAQCKCRLSMHVLVPFCHLCVHTYYIRIHP